MDPELGFILFLVGLLVFGIPTAYFVQAIKRVKNEKKPGTGYRLSGFAETYIPLKPDSTYDGYVRKLAKLMGLSEDEFRDQVGDKKDSEVVLTNPRTLESILLRPDEGRHTVIKQLLKRPRNDD